VKTASSKVYQGASIVYSDGQLPLPSNFLKILNLSIKRLFIKQAVGRA
jgi:hypothetical protein